ncbi:VOC family protein [uncultured Litoreibacter sp.]|uniref:VOC family protein n=1 Tax=uncultured Litoreibacter sp. TaxID=1392394 RepID=UPI00261217B3|nr:VOC family protein [uncultured Litoreibacter sp.]
MTVLRIVVDVATDRPDVMQRFYNDLFDLDIIMDPGWITTMTSGQLAPAQISFLSEGGSGAPVPDLSIEVDDVEQVYRRAKQKGCDIRYDLTDEPWGVRRFFVADPAGKLLNVLEHLG